MQVKNTNIQAEYEDYKGVHYQNETKKYIDPDTGAHFAYADLFQKLIGLTKVSIPQVRKRNLPFTVNQHSENYTRKLRPYITNHESKKPSNSQCRPYNARNTSDICNNPTNTKSKQNHSQVSKRTEDSHKEYSTKTIECVEPRDVLKRKSVGNNDRLPLIEKKKSIGNNDMFASIDIKEATYGHNLLKLNKIGNIRTALSPSKNSRNKKDSLCGMVHASDKKMHL